MKRIHWHWTAGSNTPNVVDRQHYHFLIDGAGKVTEGVHPPEANRSTADGVYAAHTRNANTDAIGIGLCGMAGAQERPFSAGKHPLTAAQVAALVELTADLCEAYGIPVTSRTTLSHAEVGPTLGIPQRGKWDITWLPGMTKPGDPVEVGDTLREMVLCALRGADT